MIPGEQRTLSLPQRGNIGWWEYGDLHGRPLFFLHGWPGSGQQGLFLHEIALAKGIRILSLDRPGFGTSTPHRGRTLLDFPPLVQGIMEAEGIAKCHLLGMSGGGPYALACAHAIPEAFHAVSICCGAVPTASRDQRSGLHAAYRVMLRINDISPLIIRSMMTPMAWFGRIHFPWKVMRATMRRALNPRDFEAMGDRSRFRIFEPSFVGAMKAGGRALYDDGFPYTQPWPFSVEEIQLPVQFWHGSHDENFGIARARELAARVPGASFTELPEGHYSLPLFHGEPIVDQLMAVGGSE